MREHNLKIDIKPFDDLLSGAKTCEVRNDDRDFQVGDTVRLNCADGRIATRTISHIQRGYGLPEEVCVLSYTRPAPARCDELETGENGNDHLIRYIMGYGGRCRECADEDGACPHDGTPCDPQIMRSAIKRTLEALEYGVSKGFIKTPFPRQNAEEVIAAKDARIAELEEHFAEMTRSCLAERGCNKALEADNKRLREALDCLTAFTNSFHITIADNLYNDVTLHLKTPHSLSIRILNDSSKSFIFKDLEERRRTATALGEVKP